MEKASFLFKMTNKILKKSISLFVLMYVSCALNEYTLQNVTPFPSLENELPFRHQPDAIHSHHSYFLS